MPTRRNRNGGLATRVLSPVSHGVGLVRNTGSRVLKTGDNVWSSLGKGVEGVVNDTGRHVNGAVSGLLTGKRRKGGRRTMKKHTRKNHTRKNRKNRKDRKNRN
jgi:hypothetical protein